MAEITKIEWCDKTFNPWIGCSKVHAGCTNCYAEADMDKRRGRVQWGPNGTRSKTSADYWKQPHRWNVIAQAERNLWEIINDNPAICTQDIARIVRDPKVGEWLDDMEQRGVIEGNKGNLGGWLPLPWKNPRVFCASLADVFEDWEGRVQDHRGVDLHRCVNCEHTHAFDGLKRTPRAAMECCSMPSYLPLGLVDLRRDLFELIDRTPHLDWLLLTKRPENIERMWPPRELRVTVPFHVEHHRPNVWLGTSVSDQATADEMIPRLLECRDLAPVLFVSAEPMLGPIELNRLRTNVGGAYRDPLGGRDYHSQGPEDHGGPCLDWVIVGGESGAKARQCDPQWVRSIVSQCSEAGIPCFVKQLGANVVTRNDMVEDQFNSLGNGWPDPHVEHDIHGFQENYQGADCRVRLRDKKGGDPLEWPEDLRVREFPTTQVGCTE